LKKFYEDLAYDILVMDRGVLGGISFIRYNHCVGIYDYQTAQLFEMMIFNFWENAINIFKHILFITIYLDTPTDVCVQRVADRGKELVRPDTRCTASGSLIRTNLCPAKIEYIYEHDKSWLQTARILCSNSNRGKYAKWITYDTLVDNYVEKINREIAEEIDMNLKAEYCSNYVSKECVLE
jgi:thymidylate kinase